MKETVLTKKETPFFVIYNSMILLKIGTRDFQNSPPFERSACFFVTITGKFEGFEYLNFETNFLKNGNLF